MKNVFVFLSSLGVIIHTGKSEVSLVLNISKNWTFLPDARNVIEEGRLCCVAAKGGRYGRRLKNGCVRKKVF